MRMYVVALATGVLVGVIYALLFAPPRRRLLRSSACSAS
jgi:xanthosine utilization system XapX-like protein